MSSNIYVQAYHSWQEPPTYDRPSVALTNAYLSSSFHDYLAYMAGAQSAFMLLILLTTLLASLLLALDLQIFITV